jgi:hypothetical protein
MKTSEAQPCVQGEDRPSLSTGDPLLGEWLQRPETRRRMSSRPPRDESDRDRAPLGDSVADAWFL